jgi:arylsulfatase A-like enzyme
VPQKYFDLYPEEQIVLPEGVRENDLEDVPDTGKKLARAGSRDFFQIRDEGKWEGAIQAYLASISFADAQVGAVLNALDRSGHADNTIVILWSDHGWHFGSKDHWHKQTLWEECTRIPFIVFVPEMDTGRRVCAQPVDMVNVFPTLLNLCGLPALDGLDGHDMTSLLADPSGDWEWPAMSQIKIGNMAVRSRNWRYIRYGDGGEELYEMKNDPFEWRNLAGDTTFEAVLEQHRKWIPSVFASPVPGKEVFFFDPYSYTWLSKEDKSFIDGNK